MVHSRSRIWADIRLDWFPGAYFKRLAKDGAKKARDLRDIPFNMVKDSMVKHCLPCQPLILLNVYAGSWVCRAVLCVRQP